MCKTYGTTPSFRRRKKKNKKNPPQINRGGFFYGYLATARSFFSPVFSLRFMVFTSSVWLQ